MGIHIYKVAGGWQAEDDQLVIACFGQDVERATAALERACQRARDIASRWANMAEIDEQFTTEELSEMEIAKSEIAHGQTRVIRIK